MCVKRRERSLAAKVSATSPNSPPHSLLGAASSCRWRAILLARHDRPRARADEAADMTEQLVLDALQAANSFTFRWI